MKTGVIQASSQRDKNELLYRLTADAAAAGGGETVNPGCFPEERETYSYVDIALEISLLLSAGAVDFIVTGCSSGQGMMLACNSLPGVLCGYVQNPQDAFLFGRINGGNAVSLPLGLNYGWAGELNLQYTLEKLFSGSFRTGYPPGDAARKRRDAERVKALGRLAKRPALEVWRSLDEETVRRALSRRAVVECLLPHGTEAELTGWVRDFCAKRGLPPDGSGETAAEGKTGIRR